MFFKCFLFQLSVEGHLNYGRQTVHSALKTFQTITLIKLLVSSSSSSLQEKFCHIKVEILNLLSQIRCCQAKKDLRYIQWDLLTEVYMTLSRS